LIQRESVIAMMEIEHHDLKAVKMGDKYIVRILDNAVIKAIAINVETLRRTYAKVFPCDVLRGSYAYWVIRESGRYLGVIYDEWTEFTKDGLRNIKLRWFTCFDVDVLSGKFREIEIPPFGIVRKALLNCKNAI